MSLSEFDALAIEAHEEFIRKLPEFPEIVVCVIGVLGDQGEIERGMTAALDVLHANCEDPACVLLNLANCF